MCQSIARWLSKLCDSKYPINNQEDCASLRIQAEIKNGRQFEDDIFTCIFVSSNFCNLIQISLKFVPERPLDITPALFQMMARCRTASIWTNECLILWRINASLDLNELNIIYTSSIVLVTSFMTIWYDFVNYAWSSCYQNILYHVWKSKVSVNGRKRCAI